MKKFRFTKIVSLALAAVIAVTTFSTNSYAMSSVAQEHVRELSAEEVTLIKSMFNAKVYASYYPDVVKELGEDETVLFTHFITFGIWEQRQPSDVFNVDVYASRNPDLQEKFGDDIIGYYTYYATHLKENSWRPIPTKVNALWYDCTIYSVYDFVQGQKGPKAGAIPVQTLNYHPGVEKQ